MKVVILAGGLGTRLTEETVIKPKPMIEIGGKPIIWHIMSIYATYGFKDFIVACGYKAEVLKQYFSHFYLNHADITLHLSKGTEHLLNHRGPDWRVSLVDTGLATQTGGRIKRLREWIGKETFMMTYGDGVGDVDIKGLLAFHKAHRRLATVTAVRPPARFGALVFNGDQVVECSEKPQVGEGWINGGFMVLEPGVLDYIKGDEAIFEREPMEQLARDGNMMAFRHEGFWQPMDTLREKHLLGDLWQSGKAPWKVWIE